MSRSDDERIADILEAAQEIAGIVLSGRQLYDENRLTQLATEHLIQIIGEAARVLNPETRAKYPDIDWGMIVGMRHFIAHHYHRVDYDQIWDTASIDVPDLATALSTDGTPN